MQQFLNKLNFFIAFGIFYCSSLQKTNNIPPKTATRKCFKFRYITTKETNVLIYLLNTSNTLGPSKIPAWALNDSNAPLAEPLCYLINQFITEVKFPVDHKNACVTPLFQKGHPEDPLNYRPISVTSALSEIFEKAFSSQITNFIEREQLLSVSQFGYRKQITTIDAILKSTDQIRLELNKKNCYRRVFRSLEDFWFYKPQNTVTETWKYRFSQTCYQFNRELFEWKNAKSFCKWNWIRFDKFEKRSSTSYYFRTSII